MNAEMISDKKLDSLLSVSVLDNFARKAVLNTLGSLRMGRFTLEENGECYEFGEAQEDTRLTAHIHVLHPSMYTDILFNGTVGAGEAYMRGSWSSPDLVKVIRLMVLNMSVLDQMDVKPWSPSRWLLKMAHRIRANSQQQSRLNIAAHYDLGNDFFSLFLDDSMMYSSAIFHSADSTLAQASEYKLARICQKLQLQAQDHLLEIGTGWGGMAIYAAQHYGCRVTSTTISRQQYEYARQRVDALGLQDRITVLFKDYRELEGQYDKLVSIEMIEAVGHQYYPAYFSRCSKLLKDDGLMLIQAITIPEQRYHRALAGVDFIQRYIFPGGCLPSVAEIMRQLGQHTDMEAVHVEDIADHYARTLRCWREGFHARMAQVREQRFNEQFIRMWEFYLCYCEGGFDERVIGTSQLLFAKPGRRAVTVLGEFH